METTSLWQQFCDCTDIRQAVQLSWAIVHAVDDPAFDGTPRATVPRPIGKDADYQDKRHWKYRVRQWLATLPDSLREYFKNIQTLKP